MKKETLFIFFRESLFQSVMADIVDFGSLAGLIWFNYHYVGNSKFFNGFILFMFVLKMINQASNKVKRFTSKKELKKYVENL